MARMLAHRVDFAKANARAARAAALTRGDGRRYGTRRMARERPLDTLAKKLLHAIEVSLTATDAARDAVQEILRRGAETGIFFAGTRRADASSSFELTAQDREFLRAVSIKPDR
jgi:hypothetical protein